MTVDLGAGLDGVALACLESIDDLFQTLGRQVFIGILEDDDHRRVDAGALTFHLFPGKRAALIGVQRIVMDLLAADIHQRFGAAQHAGRGAADLNVGTRADRLQLELRIEGRNFKNTDIGHVQHVCDFFNGGAGNPAILLLGTHEQRDDR